MAKQQRNYFNFNSARQPAKGIIKYPFLKVLPAHITADSITVVSGGAVTGSVADIQDEYDGTAYGIAEIAATPGFEFIINFANVPFFKFVRLICAYEGSATHTVMMQLYDNVAGLYQTKRVIQTLANYSLTPGLVVVNRYETVIEDPSAYISGGVVKMRVIHASNGNASHDIHVQYASLF